MQKPFNAKQIHILNVAEELIAQNGFENTSVREISKNANINVAMISYYFGSKEKMMTCLYEYRIQRSKEKFSELTQILGNIKPEIQIKEIINFVVGEVLKYTHFHGFVTQEMKNSERVKNLLTDFYIICTNVIEKIIEKGMATGVFKKPAKAEDIISTIVGTVLFTIRNRPFYEKILNCTSQELPSRIEKKVIEHLHNSVFAILGFDEN